MRDTAKAKNLGVEARKADYSKPETLEPAFQGIDTLLLISSSEIGQRIDQHLNIIEAAKKAGVKHIVYTSLLHADTSPLTMLATEHLATEKALKDSGLDYTILRNGWYTENYSDSAPAAIEHGVLVGSAGEGKISSAPREDYAEAAVSVLTSKDHKNKTYELAGDTFYTLKDLAAEISRQSGKNIVYKDVPCEEYQAILKNAGLPDMLAEAIPVFDIGAKQGALYHEGKDLSKIICRPTTPLSAIKLTA